MDNNESIVRTWLESQGFLVQNRLRVRVKRGASPGWSDVDLIAFRPSDGKRVAVDVTAWMTEKIRFSYVSNPKNGTYKRLHNVTSTETRSAIRKALGVSRDSEYEIWHVVSFVSDNQRDQVITECRKYVDRVVEFPEIMRDLVTTVKKDPNPTQESETLHAIRALILCGML